GRRTTPQAMLLCRADVPHHRCRERFHGENQPRARRSESYVRRGNRSAIRMPTTTAATTASHLTTAVTSTTKRIGTAIQIGCMSIGGVLPQGSLAVMIRQRIIGFSQRTGARPFLALGPLSVK